MSKGADLREAVEELHLYLSDRIAPLMFAYSMELLLQQPATLIAAEVRTWAGQQAAAMPDVSLADLLFHAVRKVAGMGQFELVSNESLGTRVKEMGQAVLPFCPPEDREVLRQNLEKLAMAPPSAASLSGVEVLRREPSAPPAAKPGEAKGLSGKVATGLRKLGLFLDRLQSKGGSSAAPPEQRAEVASQFMTTAADLDRFLGALAGRLRQAATAVAAEPARALADFADRVAALPRTAPREGSG